MTTYVALLYSIILGEGRRVNMGELRAMATRLGLAAPRTLVATGNLVFEAKAAPAPRIEARLEAAFADTFGRHVDIIVRSAAGWRRLVAANPFPEESAADARRVIVRVNRDPAGADVVVMLDGYRTGDERLSVVDGDLWAYFPHGVATSRLATAMTPKRLGIGTSRNWNTARRLGEMVGG